MPRKPKTDQKRLPRTTRAKQPPRFRLMPRDVRILRAVLDYRFVGIDQVALVLGEKVRGVELRLRLLFHHGFVGRVNLPVALTTNMLIYSLTEKGAKLLAEAEGIGRDEIAWNRFQNQVSRSHIQHLLAINDVMIAYEVALAQAMQKGEVEGYRIDRGEPTRNRLRVAVQDERGQRRQLAVVPDVILKIVFAKNKPALFFIEVDRGTMSKNRWSEKMWAYREYMRSPKLPERFAVDSFIVLTVAPSDRRIASLAEATAAIGGRRGFWFASAEKATAEYALARIWQRASDFKEGTTDDKCALSSATD